MYFYLAQYSRSNHYLVESSLELVPFRKGKVATYVSAGEQFASRCSI